MEHDATVRRCQSETRTITVAAPVPWSRRARMRALAFAASNLTSIAHNARSQRWVSGRFKRAGRWRACARSLCARCAVHCSVDDDVEEGRLWPSGCVALGVVSVPLRSNAPSRIHETSWSITCAGDTCTIHIVYSTQRANPNGCAARSCIVNICDAVNKNICQRVRVREREHAFFPDAFVRHVPRVPRALSVQQQRVCVLPSAKVNNHVAIQMAGAGASTRRKRRRGVKGAL